MLDRVALLHEFLTERRSALLHPGRHDCALFAADWVKQLTGVDLAEKWRGTYSSIARGRADLAADGIPDPVDLAALYLDELPGWMSAQVGDVAVVLEQRNLCFGIVGGGIIHVLALRGLDQVPLDRAVRVFRP